MVITKTPYRISFFGGGTDYPSWYLNEGGAVLSTSIDKYCYISCRFLPSVFENRFRIIWSHIENVNTIGEILHPAVREGLRFLKFNSDRGLEIHHQGDLPARTGIGSSSTFAVGLVKALTTLKQTDLNTHELAMMAIELEQKHMKDQVGSQDQVAAAYGGLNFIEFLPDGQIRVNPIPVSPERLHKLSTRLLLVYSGQTRIASEVASSIVSNIRSKTDILREMRKMVDIAIEVLVGNRDLDDFGKLLHEAYLAKCSLANGVRTQQISDLYDLAIANGALGGKVLGAGGGGFMLFYVPPENRQKLTAALSNYLLVPFEFDTEGCTVIHNSESNVNSPHMNRQKAPLHQPVIQEVH